MTINLSKLIPNLLSSVLKPDLPGDNRPYLCYFIKDNREVLYKKE